MTTDLALKLHKPSIKPDLKGKVCKPEVGLKDSAFKYVPSLNTDLEATFARVFGSLGERKRERV